MVCHNTRILPLQDLDLNTFPINDHQSTGEDISRKPKRYSKKKEINMEGKMVADGIDASQGQFNDNNDDFQPAVSRSTRRRFFKRQARRQSEASSDIDSQQDVLEEGKNLKHSDIPEETKVEEKSHEVETLEAIEEVNDLDNSSDAGMEDNDGTVEFEEGKAENIVEGSEHLEISSHTNESLDVSCVDDESRGMQIRELHRWILKCHACFKVTTEIGRIFCPNCGNGGTLRKVAVTVGENGIVIAARRMRVSIRGTKFSLPRPQGGREAITKNPVLREDQLPHKFLYPKFKKKNKEGDEIFSSDDIFHHHTDKRAPLRPPVRKALAVFSGKRNPNDNHYSRSSH